ncbi:MAG: hypothetical protein M1272_05345 [Firmicutes bacterium]|nr:hypothetical protein [Bacillota bacterium]
MRQARRLTWMGLRGWIIMGAWVWALPVLMVWGWTGSQARLGWGLATGEAVVTWAAMVVVRGAAVLLYNYVISSHWPFTFITDDTRLFEVPLWPNIIASGTGAVPSGLAMAVLANLWGWTVVLPNRWTFTLVVVPAMAWIYALGTLVLYNRLVVPWFGPIDVEIQEQGGRRRLAGMRARSVRRAISLVTFGWLGTLLLVGALVAGILLTAVAHHFPAGAFGAEVAAFGLALAAFIGYWLAVVVGLWYGLGARVYQWWRGKGGGLDWQDVRDEVNV